MRRSIKGILPFLLLALLMVLAWALPAMAADPVSISVNGDRVTFGAMYQENGVSMVAASDFARLSGAQLARGEDGTCTLTENGTTLVYTPGVREALLNDKAVPLPAAPVQSGNILMVPLRFTAVNFGYQVAWDGEKKLVCLTRQEVKDGMTPVQLLAKSTQAAQAINTYQMSGNLNISLDISVDGKPVSTKAQNMESKISGSVCNKPLAVYMTQVITPAGGTTGVTMETYMTGDKMYINQGGSGWMVLPSMIPPGFIEQQQEIQSDPLKAAAEMEKMGMLLSFGDDVTLNGNDYYVINATADPDKFMQYYQALLQKFVPGLPLSGPGAASGGSTADMQETMKKIMQNYKIDFFYTVYINKKTLLSDMIKLDGNMQMNINAADLPAPTNVQGGKNTPQDMQMKLNMLGSFNIQNPGSPFTPPDVSGAKTFTAQ